MVTPAIPLQIDVVIARYQGERRISSLPYSLAVNTGAAMSQLNMSLDVPIPSGMGGGSFNYRPVGNSIECKANSLGDGRFDVYLSVDGKSVHTNPAEPGAGAVPARTDVAVIRSFQFRNSLLLRDGQSRQYTVATDGITGEVIKVDVTLRVVKDPPPTGAR